jgi:hypothetical protein
MNVYVDMDGVLVDFHGGLCRAHCRQQPDGPLPWEIHQWFNMSIEDTFRPINYPKFWANLEWTVFGQDLLTAVEAAVGVERISLLTKIPEKSNGAGAAGKLAWIGRHIPDYLGRLIMVTDMELKSRLAAGAILLDDSDDNCDQWDAAGGVSLRVPQPWNTARGGTIRELVHDLWFTIQYIGGDRCLISAM